MSFHIKNVKLQVAMLLRRPYRLHKNYSNTLSLPTN